MKKYLYVFLGILSTSLTLSSFAFAETITSFSSSLELKKDSSYTVTEKIVYDFEGSARHGIYRTIPYAYQRNGTNYTVRLIVQEVTDEKGTAIPFVIEWEDDNMKVRIGDPERLITGIKTYVVTYQATRAINFLEKMDELYWNVTGSEWSALKKKGEVSATVTLPEAVSAEQLQLACYTGAVGSSASACSIKATDTRTIQIHANTPLSASEDLSFVIGLPKGFLIKASTLDEWIWFFQDNLFILLALVLPLLVFVFSFRLWWSKGRDPRGRGTIMPEFSPPKNLTPGEMGTLLDEKADMKDISATIIDLAVKGFIKIKEIEKKGWFGSPDYEFIKLKDATGTLKEHETLLLESVFGDGSSKNLSALKEQFHDKAEKIKEKIYRQTVALGFFPENPTETRMKYIVLGIGIGITIGVAGIFLSEYLIASAIVCALIPCAFSFAMVRKTEAGVRVLEETLGFKEYLRMAEKDRINFLNAPDKKPETFERYLPFAMVLGVETLWAKQFEDMYTTPPDWYDGNWQTFNTVYMVHNLSAFSQQASTIMTSVPQSTAGSGGSGFGGGGFSGGGFGGGGGGSW